MTNLELAKSYDFENVPQYFDYIVDSYYNGQKQQCKELHSQLDAEGRAHFLIHLQETCSNGTSIKILGVLLS